MKATKLVLQIAALVFSMGMFAYLIINGKVGIESGYFVDDYLILAVLSLLLLIGFNKDKWRYDYELYENTAISTSSFAMFISSLFHCFVRVEIYNRVIDNEFIAISVMNTLPFAIFALAMIKTIYKNDGQAINNALPIISLVIMLAFGVVSYIENQSKHYIIVAVICAVIIASKIIENRILNKEALQDV